MPPRDRRSTRAEVLGSFYSRRSASSKRIFTSSPSIAVSRH
jgi:hypothetical protein